MQGINGSVSREELRKVVEAEFRAQGKESARISRRICEETGMPYDPREEIRGQVLSAFMIDPYVDYLMGTINEEELRTQMTKIVKEHTQAQMLKDIKEGASEQEKEELRQVVGKMTDAGLDSVLSYFSSLFPMGEDRNIQYYYQRVFLIAKERGIAPAEVITDAELRREVIKNNVSREEFQSRIQKALPFLDPDNFLDVMLRPMFKALASQIEADGENPDDLYREFKEMVLRDAKLQQQMKTAKEATLRILEEEISKIYG